MNPEYPIHYPQFFTATILDWKHLLLDDKHKNIIIDSLKFLVSEKRVILNAFVIMNNHIHLIWQPAFAFTPSDVQASFMKHTAKQLKGSLTKDDIVALETYKVNKYDRLYQIWKRESLSIELRTHAVFMQKLEYIHYNPVKAGLCANPEDYYYSSAKFYFNTVDDFGILTHYSGN
ncbi:REP-associated tyrosine transposase [Ferruginibacter sp.]|nr:transposase [Ferruginibacter sp.]